MVTRVQTFQGDIQAKARKNFHCSKGSNGPSCYGTRGAENGIDVDSTSNHRMINKKSIYEQFEDCQSPFIEHDWFPTINQASKNFDSENLVDCQMDYLGESLNILNKNCNKDDSKTTGCSSDMSDDSNQISNSFSSSSASTEEGDESSCHFSSSSSSLATNSKWGKKPIDQNHQWTSTVGNQDSPADTTSQKKLNSLLRKQVLSRFLNHTDDLLQISEQLTKKCEKIEMKLLGVSMWEARNDLQTPNSHPWTSNSASAFKTNDKDSCTNACDEKAEDAIVYQEHSDHNAATHENISLKCHKRNLKQPVQSYIANNSSRHFSNAPMRNSRQNNAYQGFSNKIATMDNCSNFPQKSNKLFPVQTGVNFSEIDIQNLHTWQSSLIIQRNFLNQQLNMPFANEQVIQSQLMYVNQSLEYVNQRITQHFLTCSNSQQFVSNNFAAPNYISNTNAVRQPKVPVDYECDTSIASDILNYHSWFERPDDKNNAKQVEDKIAKTNLPLTNNPAEILNIGNYCKNSKSKQITHEHSRSSKPTSLFDTSSSKSQNIWKFDKDQL